MEIRGWLFKRSSGRVKSWKRRYFVLDQNCVLQYFSCDPVEKEAKFKGSLQITSFVDNAGPLKKKIPRQHSESNAILFTTTDPNKQLFLVVTESSSDKDMWISQMNKLFQPERTLDLSRILSQSSINYGSRFDMQEIVTDSNGFADIDTLLPSNVHKLIACFLGDIQQVALLSGVSKEWRSSLHLDLNSKLWTWLVRQGTVKERNRWKFWCLAIGAPSAADRTEFNELIQSASTFNKYEIEKDVNRAFGVSISKRMTDRRSILPPSITDLSLDDTPTKYRPSLGGMGSITEGGSHSGDEGDPSHSQPAVMRSASCNTDASFSSDEDSENGEEGGDNGRKNWGRGGRSTMAWPDTPDVEAKKRSRKKKSRAEGGREREPLPDSARCELQTAMSQESSSSLSPPRTPTGSRSASPSPPATPLVLSQADIQRKKLSLTRILQAISSRFESVGYCQGLDRIVVHCMRASRCAVSSRSCPDKDLDRRDEIDEVRERECFAFLDKLFAELALADVYSADNVFGLRSKIWILGRLFEHYCPELHHNLEEEGVSMEIFSIGWIQTLFLYVEAMPAHTIDRIWDIFVFERSWVIIFQVAIAIMRLSESTVLGRSIDFVINYFNMFPNEDILEPEVLLKEASLVRFDADMLGQLEEQYSLLS